MRKSLLLSMLMLFFCTSFFAQSETNISEPIIEQKIDYIAEKNYQLLLQQIDKSKSVDETQLLALKETYQNNTLSASLRNKIIESYIEDSDYKTWPPDLKKLGIFVIEKYEKENSKSIPFYKQGRKATIRQIGTLLIKEIPELDPYSGVILSVNQQIQLVRERMPKIMSN